MTVRLFKKIINTFLHVICNHGFLIWFFLFLTIPLPSLNLSSWRFIKQMISLLQCVYSRTFFLKRQKITITQWHCRIFRKTNCIKIYLFFSCDDLYVYSFINFSEINLIQKIVVFSGIRTSAHEILTQSCYHYHCSVVQLVASLRWDLMGPGSNPGKHNKS